LIAKQKPTGETEVPTAVSRALMIQNSIEEHWYAGSVKNAPTISIQEYFEEEGLRHKKTNMEIAQSITTPSTSRTQARRRDGPAAGLDHE